MSLLLKKYIMLLMPRLDVYFFIVFLTVLLDLLPKIQQDNLLGKLIAQIFTSLDDYITGTVIKPVDILGVIRFTKLYFQSIRTRRPCSPGMYFIDPLITSPDWIHCITSSDFWASFSLHQISEHCIPHQISKLPFHYIGFLSIVLPHQISELPFTSFDFWPGTNKW